MKPKLVLINPWVYDFSAVNLWSRPLGLLRVAEYLSRSDSVLKLIDCTDVLRTAKKYGTGKYPREIIEKPDILKSVPRNFARYGISVQSFKDELTKHLPCDAVLVTSIMAYWYPGVHKAIEIVKTLSPSVPVILGGIYPSLYYQHAVETSGADYVFRGHLGSSVDQNLETVLGHLGITLADGASPTPYYRLNLYRSYPFAPLLTSTGCPFRCSYCASSILSDSFIQRNPSEVINEIKDLYRMGIRDFAFYDEALLVNAEGSLKIILKEVVQSGLKLRFHCPNGIHARYIDGELASLMRQAGFMTIRLSLETIDRERQEKTGGKITSEGFVSAVRHLQKKGFTKNNLGVYLMYGLPGQTMEEVQEGVTFLSSLNVRINLTEFSPIPGTSCWEQLKSNGTVTDRTDPLVTNNSAFSLLYTDYGADGIDALKNRVKEYNSRP